MCRWWQCRINSSKTEVSIIWRVHIRMIQSSGSSNVVRLCKKNSKLSKNFYNRSNLRCDSSARVRMNVFICYMMMSYTLRVDLLAIWKLKNIIGKKKHPNFYIIAAQTSSYILVLTLENIDDCFKTLESVLQTLVAI